MISYLEVFLAALPYKADHRAMRRYTRGRHCFDRVEHVVSSILTARTADRNPHQVYVYVSLSLSSLFIFISLPLSLDSHSFDAGAPPFPPAH